MAQFGLKGDQDQDQGQYASDVEDPTGDNEVQLARERDGHSHDRDRENYPEGPRVSAPAEHQVDPHREHEGIDKRLPPQCTHGLDSTSDAQIPQAASTNLTHVKRSSTRPRSRARGVALGLATLKLRVERYQQEAGQGDFPLELKNVEQPQISPGLVGQQSQRYLKMSNGGAQVTRMQMGNRQPTARNDLLSHG